MINKIEITMVDIKKIIKPALSMRLETEKSNIKELANSISKVGLINPVTLNKNGKYYEVVAGFRRFLACDFLHWKEVPSIVIEESNELAVGIMTAENYERENVNTFDEAVYLKKLMDTTKMSQKQVAKAINRSEAYVSERIAIISYIEELRDALYKGKITFSVARELNKIADDADKAMYCRYAVNNGCTPEVARGWRKQLELQAGAKLEDIVATASENYNTNTGGTIVSMPCRICSENTDVKELVTMYVCPTCLGEIKRAART